MVWTLVWGQAPPPHPPLLSLPLPPSLLFPSLLHLPPALSPFFSPTVRKFLKLWGGLLGPTRHTVALKAWDLRWVMFKEQKSMHSIRTYAPMCTFLTYFFTILFYHTAISTYNTTDLSWAAASRPEESLRYHCQVCPTGLSNWSSSISYHYYTYIAFSISAQCPLKFWQALYFSWKKMQGKLD